MSPFIAEIIGTGMLLLLGGGVVANVVLNETKGKDSGWVVITTAWALSVYVAVIIAGPYSGAHLNPAVTLSLAIAGKFEWQQVPTYILGEFIGAMLGSSLVWILYKDHFDKTEDSGLKRAVFCTEPAIRNLWNNLLNEAAGTFVLVFTIFYITGPSFEQGDSEIPIGMGSIGALPVAFLVWAIGLCLGGTTGYAINPARDLGPRIMHAILPIKDKGGNDWSYAPIPVLGPITGGALAAGLHILLL